MVSKRAVAELTRRVELERGQSQGEYLKTASMFRLERKFNKNIYALLAISAGTGKVLAKKYDVDASLISRWRKRLGIINVPNPGQFSRLIV